MKYVKRLSFSWSNTFYAYDRLFHNQALNKYYQKPSGTRDFEFAFSGSVEPEKKEEINEYDLPPEEELNFR